jgi:hypothetical protein
VVVWELSSPERAPRTFRAEPAAPGAAAAAFHAAAFSPDGATLYALDGAAGKVSVLRSGGGVGPRGGASAWTVPGEWGALSIATMGREVVVGGWPEVWVLDARSPSTVTARLEGHGGAVGFAIATERLLVTADEGQVRAWPRDARPRAHEGLREDFLAYVEPEAQVDRRARRVLEALGKRALAGVTGLAWAEGGATLAVAHARTETDPAGIEPPETRRLHALLLAAGDLGADAVRVPFDARARAVDGRAGSPELPAVVAVSAGGDGTLLALATGADLALLRLGRPPTVLASFPEPGYSHEVAVAPGSSRHPLASGGTSGRVALWEAREGGAIERRDLVPALGPVWRLTFSPSGDRLAAGDGAGRVVVWRRERADAPFGEGVAVAVGEGPVTALAFAPAGDVLAAGGDDGEVVLLDVATERPTRLAGLRLRRGAVRSLAYAAGGSLLAVGVGRRVRDGLLGALADPEGGVAVPLGDDHDGALLVFDATEPRSRAPILVHQRLFAASVTALAPSPDSVTLAYGTHDGRVGTLLVSPDALASRIVRTAVRNLSREEWVTVLGTETPYERTCPELPDGE